MKGNCCLHNVSALKISDQLKLNVQVTYDAFVCPINSKGRTTARLADVSSLSLV